MHFDDLLKTLGEFGTFQKRQYALICILSSLSVMGTLGIVFLGAQVDHHCKVPTHYIDWVTQAFGALHLERSNITTEPCPEGRIYSEEPFKSTLVSEFDLSCENAWQLSTCKSVLFAGKLLGMLVSGVISDRKIVEDLKLLNYLHLVPGMEFVGTSKRRMAGLIIGMVFGLGHALLALEAYFIRNWRHLALVANSPAVIFALFWVLPESVRWLLAQGRHDEAKAIITRVAVVNKVTLDPDVLDGFLLKGDQEKRVTHTPVDLLKTLDRAKVTLNIALVCTKGLKQGPGQAENDIVKFDSTHTAAGLYPPQGGEIVYTACFDHLYTCHMFVNAFVYYGLSFGTQALGGSFYLNFALMGLAEIPGQFLVLFVLDRIGRRKILFIFMAIGGLACVFAVLIPNDMQWLTVTLALLGKMAISTTFAVIYMVTSEIYPTVIRHVSLSFHSSIGRLGGLLAPQILLLETVYKPLPFIVIGLCSVTAGGLAMLLPETLGKPLSQTMAAFDTVINGRTTTVQNQEG
ncbi:solute carrier family 22 member 3-like [Lingula anatina]|uniref:Solute carrier family 22 member 3-like n=1 Tax=Lingula anatina TaxID=7574 RepID=A0A2R2MPE6_LINAN|nr:solute carrier family 22 member 3-like [Lingula anatina]|eukprot:XP_023932104.1 solute carrier family 22 member 3-like [Lingula anatina]